MVKININTQQSSTPFSVYVKSIGIGAIGVAYAAIGLLAPIHSLGGVVAYTAGASTLTTGFALYILNDKKRYPAERPSCLKEWLAYIATFSALKLYHTGIVLKRSLSREKIDTGSLTPPEEARINALVTNWKPRASTSSRRTPLHYAALVGDKQAIKQCLDDGYDIEAKDIHGQTPLFLAVQYPEIVKLLIDRGAKFDERDHQGKKAIDYVTPVSGESYRLLTNAENSSA